MYILILIISLKSQFNHALDFRSVSGIKTEIVCKNMAEKSIRDLKHFNPDVEVEYSCYRDGTTIISSTN